MKKNDLYEKQNKDRFNQLVKSEHGLLITEYEQGDVSLPPHAPEKHSWRFNECNRIVAASLILFAWQWPQPGSGVMNTIAHAKSYGRVVRVGRPYHADWSQPAWAGTMKYVRDHPSEIFDPSFDFKDALMQQHPAHNPSHVQMMELIEEIRAQSHTTAWPYYSQPK